MGILSERDIGIVAVANAEPNPDGRHRLTPTRPDVAQLGDHCLWTDRVGVSTRWVNLPVAQQSLCETRGGSDPQGLHALRSRARIGSTGFAPAVVNPPEARKLP